MVREDGKADGCWFFSGSPELGDQNQVALLLAHLFPIKAYHASVGIVPGKWNARQ